MSNNGQSSDMVNRCKALASALAAILCSSSLCGCGLTLQGPDSEQILFTGVVTMMLVMLGAL
eukprot:10883928-Alexandrium_andersonii.AAC.1